MQRRKCKHCLWADQCADLTKVCDHFYPATESAEEREWGKYIERERERYHRNWNALESSEEYNRDDPDFEELYRGVVEMG